MTRIDKMRAKRAFEASLPPIDDVARLPLRQRMIEEWEAKEWEEREQEILSIQDKRLELLDNALQVRVRLCVRVLGHGQCMYKCCWQWGLAGPG